MQTRAHTCQTQVTPWLNSRRCYLIGNQGVVLYSTIPIHANIRIKRKSHLDQRAIILERITANSLEVFEFLQTRLALPVFLLFIHVYLFFILVFPPAAPSASCVRESDVCVCVCVRARACEFIFVCTPHIRELWLAERFFFFASQTLHKLKKNSFSGEISLFFLTQSYHFVEHTCNHTLSYSQTYLAHLGGKKKLKKNHRTWSVWGLPEAPVLREWAFAPSSNMTCPSSPAVTPAQYMIYIYICVCKYIVGWGGWGGWGGW